jgi:hypothetical protein
LNFDFTSRLIRRPEEYKAYKALMGEILLDLTQDFAEPPVIKELLHFCHQRNFLIRCLQGSAEPVDCVRLMSNAANLESYGGKRISGGRGLFLKGRWPSTGRNWIAILFDFKWRYDLVFCGT